MDETCECGTAINDFTVVCPCCGKQVHTPERVIAMYAIHLKHCKSEIARLKGLIEGASKEEGRWRMSEHVFTPEEYAHRRN